MFPPSTYSCARIRLPRYPRVRSDENGTTESKKETKHTHTQTRTGVTNHPAHIDGVSEAIHAIPDG